MIDTKVVEDRREMRFESMDEILGDAEALDGAGQIRAAGNWTPAQNLVHLAEAIEHSIDGYGTPMPAEAREQARSRRDAILAGTFPAGIPIPDEVPSLEPPADVSWADALAHLRRAVKRSNQEQMATDHPLLGPLTHEQWVRFHCRHAELHFSFLHPAD